MNYLSVCSGIEAASVAWKPLGWEAVAFAEIDKFPSAVLAHHYPDVPNLGDFTKIDGEKYRGAVDLIVGGTPCQDFSIAGKREGMAGKTGGLALEFVKLVRTVSPRWLVWENVPGVLSQYKGRDFAEFASALVECGYHCAYRILDAKHFGVPQRRRRVFLVGYLGDWRPSAAVLFEPDCLCRDTAPRGKKKKDVSGKLEAGLGGRGFPQDQLAGTLTARFARNGGASNDDINGNRLVTQALTARLGGGGPDDNKAQGGFYVAAYGGNFAGEIDVATTLKNGNQRLDMESETFVIAHTLRAEGFDASEDGTGRQNLVVAFHGSQDPDVSGDVTHPCGRNGGRETCVMAFTQNQQGDVLTGNVAPAIGTNSNATGRTHSRQILDHSAVRRLTPTECERLQGFPDDYTLIPYGKRKKPAKDGPRYRALGNSMAVNVMEWIGKRIDELERQIP